jgi:hypothetical protein
VCETSVRLITGHEQVSRVEFGEVIERARWTGDGLQVRHTAGNTGTVSAAGGQLTVIAGAGGPRTAREGNPP